MRTSWTMIVWLKRGLLLFGLLSAGLMAILYFWSVAIVEALIMPQVEARGGQLELESIRVGFSGAELRVEHYQEAKLRLEGLSVTCPWSQLWALRDGFAGSVHVDTVRLEVDGDSAPGTNVEPVSPEVQVAAIADLLGSLPLRVIDVVVDDLQLEISGQVLRFGLDANLVRGVSGETHLAAAMESESVSMEARVKVLAEGKGLALDFVFSTGSWDDFQATYLRPLSAQWAQAGMEVYVDSLGSERGFMDVSGYARWLAADAEKLSYTVLADLGACEVYLPQGELMLPNASAGLAIDGAGHTRAYVKGAVDSVRVGSWMASGGDWALRLDGAKLVGEFRIGETVSLSWAHDDWEQLLAGSGDGRFYLEAGAVDAELLRTLKIPELPDDLELDMAVRIEGEGALQEWRPETAEVKVTATVREARLASKGISIVNVDAQANLKVAAASLESGKLDLAVEHLDVLGFALNQMKVDMVANQTGAIAVQPITADLMGGVLRIEAMQFDLQALENFNFRARLDAVDLAQLAAAVPQFKGEVSGNVSGYLVGAVRDGQPVLTDGRLEIDSDTGARISYDVSGLLTSGMSETSPAYKQYRMAELAFQDLALKRFSIDVFPEGNTSRPFRLELYGESLQGKTVVPVEFNLNVNVDDTASLLKLLRMIQRSELDLN